MDTKRVASVALLFAISLVCSQGAAGLQPRRKARPTHSTICGQGVGAAGLKAPPFRALNSYSRSLASAAP